MTAPRMPHTLATLAIVAALTGAACAPRTPRSAHAPAVADSILALSGLSEPVRVITDRWGIPHVHAENLDDLYIAWGFVTARDRLWQLLYSRQGGRGRLHEWLGNRSLREDGGAQLFELRERADRIWARDRERPEVRKPLEAFAAGVNAYLALCRSGARPWPDAMARIPHDLEDWKPEDSMLILLGQGLVLDLAVPELDESDSIRARGAAWVDARYRFEGEYEYTTIPDSAALRLYGSRRPTATATSASVPIPLAREARRGLGAWLIDRDGESDGRASNVFAVGGKRSASGKPMLANDPHLGLTMPSALYVMHVTVPGIVDAAGASVPGLPAIVSGRNRACAWGITALSADVIDVYADTLSVDLKHVRWRGAWTTLEVKPFALRYRVLGVLPIPAPGQKRRYTPHGPVLVFDKKHRLALSARWAGNDDDVTLSRLLGLERSESAPEVAERYRTQVTPGLNVVAADTTGCVLYQTVGAIPHRGFTPARGVVPDDGRHEWQGTIPPAEMPAWRAPPNGIVVNANNRPVGPNYPEPLPRYDWAHDRANRIAERLAAPPLLTMGDLSDAQNNILSRAALRFVPRLLRAIDTMEVDRAAPANQALDLLRAWDGRMTRERVAPTIFRGWLGAFTRRSNLGGVQGLAVAALDGRAPEALHTPGGTASETPAYAANAALDLALRELKTRLGPDINQWTWGRAHRARFAHALVALDSTLEPKPVAADGDNSTPSVGRSGLPWSTTFTHGPVFRHLVDLAVQDSSLAILPPGNAEDRASGHALDLLPAWADHQAVPLYLSWDRIGKARESLLDLMPAQQRVAVPRY